MQKTIIKKVNPEIEFSDDMLMQRLHKNQIKIFQEVKHLNGKQLSECFKKKYKTHLKMHNLP